MNLIKKINVDIEGNVNITYLCDGQEILPESYYMLEADLENVEEDYGNELAEYNYDEEPTECQCIDCILERYVERMQEVAFGCPHCIREILLDLVKEIDC